MLGDLGEQLGGLRCLAGEAERPAVAVGALEEAGHDLAAFLHQTQHVAAEFLGVGNAVGAKVDLDRHRLVGLWGFLLHRVPRRAGGERRSGHMPQVFVIR
jgi:hypothetical protein